MNRSFIVAVLTVTMIIMMSTAGYAVVAPHNFACDNCHGKHLGEATINPSYANNGCIGCHSTMGEASRMPIDADAMSNYFGSAAGQPQTGSRSTHTWGAATPYNSASFVQEPLATGLNTGFSGSNLRNTVLCIRCHNAKSDTNTQVGISKPFLRVTNANDALCLDCHRSRQTTSHTTGSHPVAYRAYSTVYKSNTTAFRKTPLSPNTNNKTAMLGNYLSSGKIVCSTCHAPHYADSNSATLDNRSTANGFAQDDPAKGIKGQMQNSKGQLLRTDPIGSSAAAINVCSSCHKETKNQNHNANGQNIQCDHCHGAHVDFTGDASLPNLYLVRRDFSNMSTAKIKLGAGVKVIYNSATSLRFQRSDAKGICQICHTPTPGVAIHDLGDTRKEDCIACHKHENGFSASNCTSCHGQPPMTSYVGGPKGKASQDYSLDESFTAHATHADPAYYNYACKNCHYEGTRADSHNTPAKTFASVFVETAGSVGDLAGRKNTSIDYNAGTRSCATVYCHSNGNPRGGTMAWKSATTPSWEYGRNKILGTASECTTCHESGSTLVSNAHYTHVTTNSFKCNVCHAATVNDATGITDRTKHANGTKDVSFIIQPTNYKSVLSASFNPVDATCVNSCHTNGLGVSPVTPAKWTDLATGACGTCHAAVATTTLHPFHFTGTTGPKLGASPDCASCHDYAAGAATHANGVVNLKAGNSCAPCHPSAAATPLWAVAAKVTCESCHTGTASVVLSQTVTYTAPLKGLNGHSQYSSATLNQVKCTTCHNAAANHIGAGAAEKRLVVTGNGLCDTCHTTAAGKIVNSARLDLLAHGGTVNPFGKYTTTSDSRARDCAGCHDTHGTSNLNSIRTSINGQTVTFNNVSTGFIVTTPNGNGIYNGLCQVCHTKTDHYRNNAAPSGPIAHYSKNCLGCHTHKGADLVFAFQGNGDCNTCHGYPPVRNLSLYAKMNNYTNAKFQDYSGGGGAHSVAGHIPLTAKKGEAWTNCSNCHNDTSHNTGGTPAKKAFVNVVVDPQFKFNNATSITYTANSCSNVSCHFKPSPNWTNGL